MLGDVKSRETELRNAKLQQTEAQARVDELEKQLAHAGQERVAAKHEA